MSPRLLLLAVLLAPCAATADDSPAARRRQSVQEFHRRAQERTGLLVPLYVCPADVHKNPVYNRLMDVKRRSETVPVWVVLNPASGPGERADANRGRTSTRPRCGRSGSTPAGCT